MQNYYFLIFSIATNDIEIGKILEIALFQLIWQQEIISLSS
jgi:hypothetical protein